jgi:hypothetical protein
MRTRDGVQIGMAWALSTCRPEAANVDRRGVSISLP